MLYSKILALLSLVLLVAACAAPLPPERTSVLTLNDGDHYKVDVQAEEEKIARVKSKKIRRAMERALTKKIAVQAKRELQTQKFLQANQDRSLVCYDAYRKKMPCSGSGVPYKRFVPERRRRNGINFRFQVY
ncbi:MAG: hypothetical protein ISR99_03075 [Parcubacteria group bacterium]|nr:hypothetical protein [Parcubacteria group bacterium]